MIKKTDICQPAAVCPFVIHHEVAQRDGLAVSFARSAQPSVEGIRAQHARNHERAAHDGYVIIADVSGDGFSGSRIDSVGIMVILDLLVAGTMTFRRLYARDRDRLGRYVDPRTRGWIEHQFAREGVEIIYSSDDLHAPFPLPGGRNGYAERSARDAFEDARLWRASR